MKQHKLMALPFFIISLMLGVLLFTKFEPELAINLFYLFGSFGACLLGLGIILFACFEEQEQEDKNERKS